MWDVTDCGMLLTVWDDTDSVGCYRQCGMLLTVWDVTDSVVVTDSVKCY